MKTGSEGQNPLTGALPHSGVTLLRTQPPHKATKTWTWDGTRHVKSTSADCFEFTGQELPIADHADLARLVERIRSDRTAVLVRGEFTPWLRDKLATDPRTIFKRRFDVKKWGVGGTTLCDVARHFAMIDIDTWVMRPEDDLNLDPEAAIRNAIRHVLPDAFWEAECFWQLSSSAGFSGNVLKVHLWFWLSAPATSSQLKASLGRWLKGVKGSGTKGIDGSLFHPIQYHFTADPEIIGGGDPLQRRTGWLHGHSSVTLPPPPPPLPPRPPKIALPGGVRPPRPARQSVASSLDALGDGPQGAAFHGVLLAATMRYAARCARCGDRDDEGTKAMLRERIRNAPADPGREADIERYCSDHYLDEIILGAHARVAGQEDGPYGMPPHYPAPSGSVDDARDALDAAIGGFIDRAGDWHVYKAMEADFKLAEPKLPPPEHAGCGDAVGVGKSTAIAKHLPSFIERMRKLGLPQRVLIGVTTHKLGRQTLDKFDDEQGDEAQAVADELNRTAHVRAAPWIGRLSPVPGSARADKKLMCKDPEAVKLANSIHVNVTESVCGSGKDGKPSCPFRKDGPLQCAWARQIEPAKDADIVVLAHQAVWHELPSFIKKDLGLSVLDENWTQSGAYEPTPIVIESLVRDVVCQPIPAAKPPKPGVRLRMGNDGLQRYSLPNPTPDPANGAANGPLIDTTTRWWNTASRLDNLEFPSRTLMLAAGLTQEIAHDAMKLTWRRMRDGDLIPGMTQAERIEAVKLAQGNRAIPRTARMWKCIAEFLADQDGDERCGAIQAVYIATPGGMVRHLVLRGHHEIRPAITDLPILTLTATLRLHLDHMRAFLPNIQVLTEANPHASSQRVFQIVMGSGKTSLTPNADVDAESPTPQNAEAKQDNLRIRRRNVEFADFTAFHGGRHSAVITFQDAERDYKLLPDGTPRQGLVTNHFNETVGLDHLKHVRGLGVFGRTLPDADAIRELAIAITGRDLPVQASHVESRGVLMEDGTGVAMDVRVFADPDLEAARAGITDASVIQDVGRGRGVNRTALDPLTVFVGADVILPYPVRAILKWQNIRPTAAERMTARGTLYSNPSSAVIAHPDLFIAKDGSEGCLAAAQNAASEAAKNGQPWTKVPVSRLALQPASEKIGEQAGVELATAGELNGATSHSRNRRPLPLPPKREPFLGTRGKGRRFCELVRFQIAQKGRRPESVLVAEELVAEINARLTRLFGPLAYCVLVRMPKNKPAQNTRPDDADELIDLTILIVCDVGFCFDLYADFSGTGKHYAQFPDRERFRLYLPDLRRAEVRARLQAVWTDPKTLDPALKRAEVTSDIAALLAKLAEALEGPAARPRHAPEHVATFLMRCIFCMFAQSVGLLPHASFTKLLERCRANPVAFLPLVSDLWATMDTGGFSIALEETVRRFNGGLFRHGAHGGVEPLPVHRAELGLLLEAASKDWAEVEPAIFGTLLENALDAKERGRLGAQFTPRAFVERLVLPTVMEPLREEWDGVRGAAEGAMRAGDTLAAAAFVRAFHGRLCAVRVLDPACGSGNFLYVTLELMKRLEGEVLDTLDGFAPNQAGRMDMAGVTVDPHQFHGLDVNPRAVPVAELVLWIGYLQWHFRTNGKTPPAEPILQDFQTVREADALLAYDGVEIERDKAGRPVTSWGGRTKLHPTTGKAVPDETDQVEAVRFLGSRQADWPEVDFIVGNPPFVAGKDLRAELGSGYAKALWAAYPKVPRSADLAMFFWWRAAQAVRTGKTQRFGFITSNSIRQVFCRRVIAAAMEGVRPLRLAFAIPDHPWSQGVGSAAVRIAMTVATQEDKPGRLLVVEREIAAVVPDVLLIEAFGLVNADLTVGVSPDSARPLRANERICSPGMKLHGAGFIVSPATAATLGLGEVPGLEAHIRPYLNGRDMTGHSRGVMIIDMFGLTEGEVRQRFPAVFQHLLLHVKPERDARATSGPDSAQYAKQWWLHGKPRPDLRSALRGLPRYIATVETAKHRLFTFQPAALLPDNMLVCVASDSACDLGVLSSRTHTTWALAIGGSLENRPRYNKTVCFDPFPFPAATLAQAAIIAGLAEELDALRKDRLLACPQLTLTILYNVLATIRASKPLSDLDKRTLHEGQVEILRHLHDRLDQAVSAAYGWPADLSAAAIVECVVALNRERAAEEAGGQVRWLRPAFQAPTEPAVPKQQLAMAVDPGAILPAWPKHVPAQYVALRAALSGKGITSPDELALHFSGVRPAKLAGMLETLAALGQARDAGSGRFAT